MSDYQVAIIGAGISGSLTAIALSDAGLDVVLIDREKQPMKAASRWNEGKIHLGYCYLGDPTFDSINLMLDGAACFTNEIERLTESPLQEHWFSKPFMYLVDTETQFPVDYLWQRSQKLSSLLIERANQEHGLRRFMSGKAILERLDTDIAAVMTGTKRGSAAWMTSELAISPEPVASLIKRAIEERKIPLIQGEARSIQRVSNHWCVVTSKCQLSSNVVVNASWESRVSLDRNVKDTDTPCSIRYKYAIFGKDLETVQNLTPSTRIVGQFGDITPYRTGDFYLSWYPTGLAGLSDNGIPPSIPQPNKKELISNTLIGLGLEESLLNSEGASLEVQGGFVVAHGHGDIDHAGSPLHSRSRPGVYELAPGYISVDTGKYSLGPLMARRATAAARQYLKSR